MAASPSPLDLLVEESTPSRFSRSLAPAHGDELTWWSRQSSPWDFGLELGNHPTRIWVGECPRRTIVGVAPTPDFGGVDLSSCYSRTSVARVLNIPGITELSSPWCSKQETHTTFRQAIRSVW